MRDDSETVEHPAALMSGEEYVEVISDEAGVPTATPY